MLVTNLPADCTTATLQRGVEDSAWGLTEHLLAAVVDVLQVANWQREQLHSKSKVKPPKPLPRPGVQDETVRHGGKSGLSNEQIKAWFQAMSEPKEGVEA